MDDALKILLMVISLLLFLYIMFLLGLKGIIGFVIGFLTAWIVLWVKGDEIKAKTEVVVSYMRK